jgi:protein arginine kinase activator
MLCDDCREETASVHLTKVVQGDVSLVHLCAKCAMQRGIETTVTSPPKNMLGEFLQDVHKKGLASGEPLEDTACSFCGMTLTDFRATGRVGCSRCYSTFESRLRELLRHVHGSAQHVGRRYVPPVPEIFGRVSTVAELEAQLRRAIDNEEFELAATLRDKLQTMP